MLFAQCFNCNISESRVVLCEGHLVLDTRFISWGTFLTESHFYHLQMWREIQYIVESCGPQSYTCSSLCRHIWLLIVPNRHAGLGKLPLSPLSLRLGTWNARRSANIAISHSRPAEEITAEILCAAREVSAGVKPSAQFIHECFFFAYNDCLTNW